MAGSRNRWFGFAGAGAALGALLVRRRRALEVDGRTAESRALARLCAVCRDAEIGARIAVDVFAYHPDLGVFFNEVAADCSAFGARLAALCSTEGGEVATTGTLSGKLLHARLRIARRIRLGSRPIDDHRINLRILGRGSTWVRKAYEDAVGRVLDPEWRSEIDRQAERIRAIDAEIYRLAADAKYAARDR